jgi:RNA polymerase sigma factor (sigma-70 family)
MTSPSQSDSPRAAQQAQGRDATPVERAFFEVRLLLKRVVARIVSNPADVEDILQDAYVKAVTGEKTSLVRNPKAYLVLVARSVALNDLQKKSRRIAQSIEAAGAAEVISNEPSAEERLIERERLGALREAVAGLPPKSRRAFILCKVYGLSYKEIAARMGISVSTVEKHMITSLRRCAAHLRKHDAGAEVGAPMAPASPRRSKS